jgi:hypothetical protein
MSERIQFGNHACFDERIEFMEKRPFEAAFGDETPFRAAFVEERPFRAALAPKKIWGFSPREALT